MAASGKPPNVGIRWQRRMLSSFLALRLWIIRLVRQYSTRSSKLRFGGGARRSPRRIASASACTRRSCCCASFHVSNVVERRLPAWSSQRIRQRPDGNLVGLLMVGVSHTKASRSSATKSRVVADIDPAGVDPPWPRLATPTKNGDLAQELSRRNCWVAGTGFEPVTFGL